MRKYLIAAHGTFSSGLKSALDIIIGKMENVFIIDAYVNENKTIEEELGVVLENIQSDDELIVFSDLMGGSITNQIVRFARTANVHVVSGSNLPVVIDIMLASTDAPVGDVIEEAISNAREQLVYVNKVMNNAKDND